uniref:Uncharacterized protein n=1 Tax=Nelumbo nucifera TaxID=4432 RepID=A0A822ZFQ4_NELNU|nr:TPA_asm: hypothetical protein HUJ06_001937 [Nelumbo nucifera]
MEARSANRQGSQGESYQLPNHSSAHAFQSPFYHQFGANHNNDLHNLTDMQLEQSMGVFH